MKTLTLYIALAVLMTGGVAGCSKPADQTKSPSHKENALQEKQKEEAAANKILNSYYEAWKAEDWNTAASSYLFGSGTTPPIFVLTTDKGTYETDGITPSELKPGGEVAYRLVYKNAEGTVQKVEVRNIKTSAAGKEQSVQLLLQ